MTAQSQKRQLEKAKQRNNKASREAFFDKLKTTGRDPLPDPTKFKIGSVLKPLFLLGIIGLVLFLGYQSLVNSDIGGTGLQDNNDDNTVVPQETPPISDNTDKGDTGEDSTTTDDFLVSVRGSIAISEPATISYGLPSSLSANDLASTDIELHLVDKDGAYVGYIADLPLSATSFDWNPQVVYPEKGSEVIQAPQQGLYHLIMALRSEGQSETPLSELDQTKISNVFDIEYDESIQESPFRCFSLREYNQVPWYSPLVDALEERSLTVSGQETSCYAPESSLVVVIMNERSERGYPLIFRFVVEKNEENDAVSVVAGEAVYTVARDQDLTIRSVNIGGRQGKIIPIIVNGQSMFHYNFVENIITAAG